MGIGGGLQMKSLFRSFSFIWTERSVDKFSGERTPCVLVEKPL